jgi:hypothetical protein
MLHRMLKEAPAMSYLPESETLSTDLPRDLPRPFSAELLVGAASPLWLYFSSVAATGAAWWWMTRLAPKNLEAMFAAAVPEAPVAEAVLQSVLAPDPLTEASPAVGGEAAPVAPVLAEIAPEPRAIDAAPPEAPQVEPTPIRGRRMPPAGPVADA